MTNICFASMLSSSANSASSFAISSSGTVEGSPPSKVSFPPMSKTMVLYLSFGGRKHLTAAIRAPGNDKMFVFGNSKCRACESAIRRFFDEDVLKI